MDRGAAYYTLLYCLPCTVCVYLVVYCTVCPLLYLTVRSAKCKTLGQPVPLICSHYCTLHYICPVQYFTVLPALHIPYSTLLYYLPSTHHTVVSVQFWTALYLNALSVLYCTLLYCLSCSVAYCLSVPYFTILYCTILYCKHCIVQYCTVCSVLYRIVL